MRELVRDIRASLERGEDLVAATILHQSGSTPRTAGTKMVMRENGTAFGTIGGGLLEAQVMEAARGVFESRGILVRPFELTGASAESTDMICGGRLEVLLEFIAGSAANLEVFQELQGAMEKGEKCFVVTDLAASPEHGAQVTRCLVKEGRGVTGGCREFETHLDTLRNRVKTTRSPFLITIGEGRCFVEPWFMPGTLVLMGAGHVSQQTAFLASIVGFRTVVMDDREEFANRERFPHADEVRVLSSFEHCFDGPEIERDTYVVIVTRGHLHDLTVLRQALQTGAGYIGMIGSKRKREMVYRALEEEGFSRKVLEQVYSPIGLSIGAETPEEIAVSIVAELVKVRAANLGS
jgi:xanthine dehydrogenase accessory factor